VKGNPKGLMRAVYEQGKPAGLEIYWFFPTKIGKNTYATICLDADFREEGAFEEWKKGDRRYFIYRYEVNEDKLIVHFGDKKAMEKLMQAEKIEADPGKYFKTPPGWLAKYLEKEGPETLYDGTNEEEWLSAKAQAEQEAKNAKKAFHAERKYGGYVDARAKATAYRNAGLDRYQLKYTDLPDNGITAERLDKSTQGKEFWVFEGEITVEVNGKKLTYTWMVMPQFDPSAGDRGLWRCKSSSITDSKGNRVSD
jgi:hypothetical protein